MPGERKTPYFNNFDTYDEAVRFAREVMSESVDVVIYIYTSRREVWK